METIFPSGQAGFHRSEIFLNDRQKGGYVVRTSPGCFFCSKAIPPHSCNDVIASTARKLMHEIQNRLDTENEKPDDFENAHKIGHWLYYWIHMCWIEQNLINASILCN